MIVWDGGVPSPWGEQGDGPPSGHLLSSARSAVAVIVWDGGVPRPWGEHVIVWDEGVARPWESREMARPRAIC